MNSRYPASGTPPRGPSRGLANAGRSGARIEAANDMLGPVEPNVLYPLLDFMARTGLGRTAMRSARRSGLIVRYVGGRGYVMGGDFIAWLQRNGKASKG